jgi:hypothetical protein
MARKHGYRARHRADLHGETSQTVKATLRRPLIELVGRSPTELSGSDRRKTNATLYILKVVVKLLISQRFAVQIKNGASRKARAVF